jgi:hypothetical protein
MIQSVQRPAPHAGTQPIKVEVGRAMKFDIRMLTCDRVQKNARAVNYVHTTIVNFLSAGGAHDNQVSLYVSHPDTRYVEVYCNQFTIVPAYENITGYDNFIRACTEPSACEFLLVLEDDLDFSTDFLPKISQWLTKHARLLDNNIVTLYTPYVEINQCLREGRELWHYPVEGFYGTQALLGTSTIMHACGEFIKNVENLPWDMAIKEWLKATNRGIISTVPCLVQHIGVISSVHGQHMHTSPGFVK